MISRILKILSEIDLYNQQLNKIILNHVIVRTKVTRQVQDINESIKNTIKTLSNGYYLYTNLGKIKSVHKLVHK